MVDEFDNMSREQLQAEILRLRSILYGAPESIARKLKDADTWLKANLLRLDVECYSTTLGRVPNGALWALSVKLPSGAITTLHAPVGHRDPFDLLVLRGVVQRVLAHVTPGDRREA